ncbi:MAG: hypothetical protein JJ913_09355 [Rhizobiaceae bacterium]|nr:hypothetical protein [Rhizobiaceae bacterium]
MLVMVAAETGLAWLNRARIPSGRHRLFNPLLRRVAGRCLVSFPFGSAIRHVRNIVRPMDDHPTAITAAAAALQALRVHHQFQVERQN